MFKKKFSRLIAVMSVCFIIAFSVPMVMAQGPPAGRPVGPPPDNAAITVSTTGLCYATIVPIPQDKGVPYTGNNGGSFQPLDNGVTPYGPGVVGYRGGRWWIDVNGDEEMDAGDIFFICPLVRPGVICDD